MEIIKLQEKVDNWINNHGVRYFNELTNMAQLTEEVGEVAVSYTHLTLPTNREV